MSYPRKLHILVVEDDPHVIESYRVFFEKGIPGKFEFVEPVYARSFSEALDQLRGPNIFHVVILDLNLPIEPRSQAPEGLAPGEQLLETAAKRESHPVPVLLVVSGKLNLAQPLSDLQHRLEADFWYGALVNKGPEQFTEIIHGFEMALRYTDVGIHIRDGGRNWYPTLSPREVDLLRRCILKRACLGVDLRWWSAENGQSASQPNPNLGPTKVLMGHFLLDDGLGTSLPTFFKFEPAGNGPHVCRAASILENKLGHAKVLYTFHTRERSLIVTQSVTNKGQPIPLSEYFTTPAAVAGPLLPGLLDQVINQLDQLGAREDDQVDVGDIFWDWLEPAALKKTWASCDTRQLRENPIEAYNHLKHSGRKLWVPRRRCTHGDLNATNVAIDATNPNAPQAYIFDAAGMRIDFEYRDPATLEITTILFNTLDADDLLSTCKAFYENEFAPTVLPDAHTSNFTKNVVALIRSIRARITDDASRVAYALLLFNAVLQQLNGLALQPSPNKVRNPMHACHLAAWIAGWVQRIAPDLLPPRPSSKPEGADATA